MSGEPQVFDPETESREIAPIEDMSLAIGLSRAEIDTQIATARRYPRVLSRVVKNILDLATLDEETAEECQYALPRAGKPIIGPSVRFAEIIASSFGNNRTASRVVFVDRIEKVVIAEGVFHDLETNQARRAEVRRSIATKSGRLYSLDMIVQTGNAACAIAIRNATLAGVPKPLWRKAFETVQRTIAGDITTLAVTREKAVKALATFGATPDQVYQALGVAGAEDIKLEHILILRGMFAGLKNGELTAEEVFNFKTIAEKDPNFNPLEDGSGDSVDLKTGEVTKSPEAAVVAGEAASKPAASEAAPASSGATATPAQPVQASPHTLSGPGTTAAGPVDAGVGAVVVGQANGSIAPQASAQESILPLAATPGDYSKALARASTEKTLKTIDAAFWKANSAPTDAKLIETFKAVHTAHEKRAKSEITPQELSDRIAGIIA